MCPVLFLRLRTKKQPRQGSCLQELRLYVMQTTFKKWLRKRIQGQLRLPQPTMKNRRCRGQYNAALGHRVWSLLLHDFPDNPEQMCSSSRGLKIAELEQDPRAEPENTTSEILMVSVKGHKATYFSKLNHQETQPSNCLPMISLFLEGDGHQQESTPKQRQSLINERPTQPRVRASDGLLTVVTSLVAEQGL